MFYSRVCNDPNGQPMCCALLVRILYSAHIMFIIFHMIPESLAEMYHAILEVSVVGEHYGFTTHYGKWIQRSSTTAVTMIL